MFPSSISVPGDSIRFEKNSWADYIELVCLTSLDKEVSLNDVRDIASAESTDGPERGSDSTSEREDAFSCAFSDVFQYLKNRGKILGDCYPFTFVDDDVISIDITNLSLKQLLYLFLLFSSNLSCFAKTDQHRLTRAFESISREVLQRIFSEYHIEVFGTASNPGDLFHGGSLIDRFKTLADCLHTDIKASTKSNPRYKQPAGDGGLDLVGYIQLDNSGAEVPFIPMCFAQCACSVEKWKEKQGSIKFDEWNQRFEQIAHYCEFVFVPFSLRGPDGRWSDEEADRITVIPIDRIRFMHILMKFHGDFTFFEATDAYSVVQESISDLLVEAER